MGAITTLTTAQGVQVLESGYGAYRRVQVRFRSHKIAGFDNAGVVGGIREKLFTLDAGSIQYLGATVNITGTCSGGDGTTTGVFNNFTGIGFGLGSALADTSNTLATTEQDLLNTAATAAATGTPGVATVQVTSGSTESAKVFDGSSAAFNVNMNWLITDALHNIGGAANSGLLIDGAIFFHYVFLGNRQAVL